MKTLVLLSIALTVCLLAQESKTTRSDSATVTIYRDSGLGTLKSPPIYMDKMQIAKLGNKRYLSFPISPGVHHFWSSSKYVVELKAEVGGKYFIRAQYPDQGGIQGFNFVPKLHLFQVTAEQGAQDIQSLQPLDPKNIFNVK